MDQDEAKRRAAEAALRRIPEQGVIGLGSGSTARIFIDLLGQMVQEGRQLRGVPTSEDTRRQAEALGIPLLDDQGPWEIALCVDGADEVSDDLDLIKGGGGALTREKIVNYAARKNLIIVDESKLSRRLGERWAVPVEVLAFAHRTTGDALARFGSPGLRLRNATPWRTDAGNFLYDLHVEPLEDPARLDRELRAVPGVVETGLFIRRADVVIVAGSAGIRELEPRRG